MILSWTVELVLTWEFDSSWILNFSGIGCEITLLSQRVASENVFSWFDKIRHLGILVL